jgi:hypothetical protein
MIVFSVSRSISFPAKPESSFNKLLRQRLARTQLPSSIFNFQRAPSGYAGPSKYHRDMVATHRDQPLLDRTIDV